MLKLVGKGTRPKGRKVKIIVLGLSRVNRERLEQGKPIVFPGEEVKIPGVEFIIFAGETEQSMAREFAEHIGPNTEVSIDPKVSDA